MSKREEQIKRNRFMLLLDLPQHWLVAGAVVLGLVWGSFVNVVIHRLPRGMSLAMPASHCPACATPIHPFDNIPLLSYLLLRGKARCCNTPISPRYPIVEALCAALSLVLVRRLVHDADSSLRLSQAVALYVAEFALVLTLVAAAFVDAAWMILPDSLTLGGALLGLGTSTLRGGTYTDSLLGAVEGFVLIWFPFVFLYPKLRGRAGMGLGDAKLLLLAGAWFGLQGALFVLFAGAIQGLVGAGILYACQGGWVEPQAVREERALLHKAAAEGDLEAQEALREDPLAEEPAPGLAGARIPFGPFLVLGCLEYLLWGGG